MPREMRSWVDLRSIARVKLKKLGGARAGVKTPKLRQLSRLGIGIRSGRNFAI